MVDVIQRLILESEVGDAKTKLEQVRKEQAKLEAAIRDSAKTTDKASAEYKEQVKALKALVDRERELEKQIQNTNDAYGDRRKVVAKTDAFDRVSQDVSLAGDVESNLRTVGGAVGAFGGAGLERGIGQGAEIFAVVEALPRLKAAAAGMPQAFSAAASAMGTSKVALGGLVVGLAALGIALQLATAQTEMQRKSAQGQLDAQRQATEFAATATRDQVEAELESARKRRELQIEGERFAKEQLEFARQQLSENFTEIGAIGVEAGAAIKLGAGEIEALRLNAAGATDTLSATNIEIATLEQSLDSSAVAANDAAEAERRLADERTQGVLSAAQQAGDLERARQQAAEQTREENQRRAQDIKNEQKALQEQLDVLKASGDTSDTVTQSIKSLETQIKNLGAQADVFKTSTGKAADSVKDAASEIDKAATATSSAARRAGGSSFAQRRADSARNRSASTIGFGFLTGQSGAEQKADTNEIDKQLRETQNSIIEVNNDYEEQRVQQAIDSNRRLQDIARDFGDQRADAFEDGNFLALDRLNTEEARANRDAAIDTRRANDDRLREQQNALRNLQQQEQQFHQQRLQLNQQGFQAALTQQQQFISAFIGNFSNMFGALSGARSGIRRPATP